MNSKWEKIAKIFDVGLNEEFFLYSRENQTKEVYKFTEEGLLEEQKNKWFPVDDKFKDLVSGKLFVCKIPYRPVLGREYFYIERNGKGEPDIFSKDWENKFGDLCRFHAGNCFKNKEDAELNKISVVKKLENVLETVKVEKQPQEKPHYIEIWEPKYSINSVLIATYKVVNGLNRIVFTKAKSLMGYEFHLSGEEIRKYPTQPNGNIDVYIVPLDAFKKVPKQEVTVSSD